MGALHIPWSWHVLDDSPFSCLPPWQEYRTVEPKVNLSPLSTPLGGEPGWPQSTTWAMEWKKREDVFLKPLQAWDYCVFLMCDETNRYTPGGVCPTVPSADRSAQVIQTGSILGYNHRKPQCQRWSCRAQFYSGGWSWQGFLDRSSWPLHTQRHTHGDRHTEMETKHVLFGKHQGGSFLSPLHFWSVSISNINANGFMHLGQPWALGMSTNLHTFRLNLRSF